MSGDLLADALVNAVFIGGDRGVSSHCTCLGLFISNQSLSLDLLHIWHCRLDKLFR